MAKTRQFWKIEGYNGPERFFSDEIEVGSLSENEIQTLLTRLACKHLDHSEIVDSSLRRNAKRYRPLLEVRRETKPDFWTCGNPYFVARVISCNGGAS